MAIQEIRPEERTSNRFTSERFYILSLLDRAGVWRVQNYGYYAVAPEHFMIGLDQLIQQPKWVEGQIHKVDLAVGEVKCIKAVRWIEDEEEG